MAKHLQRLQPSLYASQSTINPQLQIMISFIFILMSTRTEPYRNAILAKKKRRRNKNQTKTKQKTYKIDCGLIVAQAALAHFLQLFPDLRSFRPAPRIHPWFWTNGYKDLACAQSRLPSGKIGERDRFFPREGGRLYTARSEPPCSIPAIFLQHI